MAIIYPILLNPIESTVPDLSIGTGLLPQWKKSGQYQEKAEKIKESAKSAYWAIHVKTKNKLATQDKTIKEKDEKIKQLENQLTAQDKTIKEKDEKIKELDKTNEILKKSFSNTNMIHMKLAEVLKLLPISDIGAEKNDF